MKLTFDPAKNARNIRDRGIDFSLAAEMDWDSALMAEDARKEYGEPRYQVIGSIGGRLHVMVATFRKGGMRVISLRKANARERKRYEEEAR